VGGRIERLRRHNESPKNIKGRPITPRRNTVSKPPTTMRIIGPDCISNAAIFWGGIFSIIQKTLTAKNIRIIMKYVIQLAMWKWGMKFIF
jgi:hypothetical protein